MMEKENKENQEEVTSFLKLPVYTREGKYVGHVKNVFLDVEEKKVSSLLVTNTNPSLVEGSVDVSVPYRWVNAVSDIVILSNFPEKVCTRKKEEESENIERQDSEIDMIE
ncbi:MAG: PRC-barrel domain-containing protein [Thermoplasmatales archaeon]|nr:MAG: PRC-barrel domain-containing protein [Thermoplasmatales archaeon]